MREHRKAPRYQFGVTGTLHPAGERVGAAVKVRDISTLGCGLEQATAPTVGEKCELYLEWRGAYIGLGARVVWKDVRGRTGMEFLAVDKDSQKRLQELCAALRTQPLVVPPPKEADAFYSVPKYAKTQRTGRSAAPRDAAPSSLKSTMEPSRRLRPRYVCELPGLLSNPATGATGEVRFVDLSVSGGRVEGPELPDAGQTCEVHTEWEGERLVLHGSVAWKVKDLAGIRFSSLDEAAENLLRRICASSRLIPRAVLPPEPG